MIAVPPSVILDELPSRVQDLLVGVGPKVPLADASEELAELRAYYRALGISRLLVQGDNDGFLADLVRSARMRLYFLRRCKGESHTDFTHGASRSGALFDALAARAFELATEIAAESLVEWQTQDEYEDDFCQAQFIHRFLLQGEKEELAEILQRFEMALEGANSSRLEICRALLAADQDAFDTAFEDLLHSREEEIVKAKERCVYEIPEVVTDRLIFVEGLGLLALAEKVGLATAEEYPGCPALARVAASGPLPGSEFPAWG